MRLLNGDLRGAAAAVTDGIVSLALQDLVGWTQIPGSHRGSCRFVCCVVSCRIGKNSGMRLKKVLLAHVGPARQHKYFCYYLSTCSDSNYNLCDFSPMAKNR
jgi:hypothetical protein